MLSMANVLSNADRAAVVAALVEGNSIRATARMTGVARNTVLAHSVRSAAAPRRGKVAPLMVRHGGLTSAATGNGKGVLIAFHFEVPACMFRTQPFSHTRDPLSVPTLYPAECRTV